MPDNAAELLAALLPPARADLEFGLAFFRADPGQPRLFIQTSCHQTSRSLPVDKANEIIWHFVGRGMKVVVLCTDPSAMASHPNIIHARGLNTRDLAGVLAASTSILAVDGGMGWLGASLGVPTTVIYGATDPAMYIRTSSNPRILVSRNTPCQFCERPECDHRQCLADIPMREIEAAVMLENAPTLGEYRTQPIEKPQEMVSLQRPAGQARKVMACLPYLLRGGSISYMARLLHGFSGRGVQLSLMATRGRNRLIGYNIPEDVQVIFPLGGDPMTSIYREMREWEPDAVICDGDHLAIWAASNLPERPRIIYIAHTVAGSIAMLEKAEHDVDTVVCVAEYLKDELSPRFQGVRLAVIPTQVSPPVLNGHGLRHEWGCSASDVIVGSLTRLVPPKGVGEMIDAMRRLPAHVKLVIGGEGYDKQAFMSQAQRYGGRIKFLGYVEDTGGFYDAIDIAALPSESEGNSLFVLEAALAGKPLVVTPVGNVPYLLKDGKSAIFVKKDPRSIAAAIARLLDKRIRAAMGAASMRAAQPYSHPDVMTDAYYELITS